MHDGTARVRLNGEPVNQMARIGTFSEEVVCPAEQVVKIRDHLPFTHAAIIGCSVATGIGAVIRHERVPAGSSVLVVGCGGVGLNVVQVARLAGASPIHRLRSARQQARVYEEFRRDAHDQCHGGERFGSRAEMTEGLGVDNAFDAIGSEKTALQVIEAAVPGWRGGAGRHPGFCDPGADQPLADRLWREDDQSHLLRFGAAQYRFPDPRGSRPGEEDQPRRPDQPDLPVRRNQRGVLPRYWPARWRAASSSLIDGRSGWTGSGYFPYKRRSLERPGSSVGRATD